MALSWKQITAGVAVVVIASAMGTTAEAASDPPASWPRAAAGSDSASGSKNCTGSGNIAVTAAFNDSSGIHVNVKQAGPPASARRWARTKDSYPPRSDVDDVTWTFVGSIKEGSWGASKITTQGPALIASAQCDRRSLPSESRVAHKRAAAKSCPSGQTVVISSDGYGAQWYSWKGTKKGAKVHHVRGFRQSTGYPFVSGFVDTNLRRVAWRRVDVYSTGGPAAERWVEAWRTGCSGDYHIERD